MKEMKALTLTDVQVAMAIKGYKIFADGRPNIVGIRSSDQKNANVFNDRCFVWWNDAGMIMNHDFTITTHPGNYYLQNPISGSGGTAILVPGQYIDKWVLAMHRGKQFALCQHAGEVSVYRDKNNDTTLDCLTGTITTGYYGIDLHNAGLADPEQVGPWSAGCQVWEFHLAHEALMASFKGLAEKYKFTNFSYTLLVQEDF